MPPKDDAEAAETSTKLTKRPTKRARVVKETKEVPTKQPASHRRKTGKKSMGPSSKEDTVKPLTKRPPPKKSQVCKAHDPPVSELHSRLRPRKAVNYKV